MRMDHLDVVKSVLKMLDQLFDKCIRRLTHEHVLAKNDANALLWDRVYNRDGSNVAAADTVHI